MVDKIYDTLEEIRLRPKMYLNEESISCLYQFLLGYELGRHHAGLKKYEQLYPLPFGNFFLHYCITKHQERFTSMVTYADILLRQCGNKEKDALWYFFEVLEEYKENARIITCEICELSEENISFYLTNHPFTTRALREDGSWISYLDYQNVRKLYRLSFSFDIDILLPVSDDEHASGDLFYRSEKEGSLLKTLEQHMKDCFGNVSWQEVKLSDEQILSLLNDYIFQGRTRELYQ